MANLDRLKKRLHTNNDARSLSDINNTISNDMNTVMQQITNRPGEDALSKRSRVNYEEVRRLYSEFIDFVNMNKDDADSIIKEWTPEGFNKDRLIQYAFYRSATGRGTVEKKIQLGTVAREISRIKTVAKREDKSLVLDEDEVYYVFSVLSKMSKQGFFGRKGKQQAIFGLPEAKILVEFLMRGETMVGDLDFQIQVALYIQLCLFTGVRPSSLSEDDKAKDGKYLMWEHITIWRNGKDDRGFIFYVNVKIPHLKSKEHHYTESQRTFIRTLASQTLEDIQYDPLLDPIIFLIALGFRRGVFQAQSFEEFYSSDSARLIVKNECMKNPVFINSQSSTNDEKNKPWLTNSANGCFSRIVLKSGLPIQGTLYAFRRNFARTINDNLSKDTASILMGHRTSTDTLKKYYSGTFERMNMSTLIGTGRIEEAHSINPLEAPAFFQIKDTSRYQLTAEETETLVDTDIKVINARRNREDFKSNLKKKYNMEQQKELKKSDIQPKDIAEWDLHTALCKQAAAKVRKYHKNMKIIQVHKELQEKCIVLDSVTGQARVDESLLDKDQQVDHIIQEEENDTDKPFDIMLNYNQQDSTDEDNMPTNIIDIYEEEEIEEMLFQAEFGTIENNNYTLPEQVVNNNSTNQDKRFHDIMGLVTKTIKPTGRLYCTICQQDTSIQDKKTYNGFRNLFHHLVEGFGLGGMHSRIVTFLKQNPAHLHGDGTFRCLMHSCKGDAKFTTKRTYNQHLKRNHMEGVSNISRLEMEKTVRNYFQVHFNYLVNQEDFEAHYDSNKKKAEQTRNKRKNQSLNKAKESKSTATNANNATPSSTKENFYEPVSTASTDNASYQTEENPRKRKTTPSSLRASKKRTPEETAFINYSSDDNFQ